MILTRERERERDRDRERKTETQRKKKKRKEGRRTQFIQYITPGFALICRTASLA